MSKVNIFDICGTLYSSNTTMDFCEFQSSGLRRAYLKLTKTFVGKIINKILFKLFGYDWIRSAHIKSLKGKSISQIESDSKVFVQEVLENKKILQVFNILDEFDKKDVLLVSATIEPVAKAISIELGNINYLATSLNLANSKYDGTIKNDLLGNKVHYLEKRDINLVITDNFSDLELCKAADKVVIVTKQKHKHFWESSDLKIERMIEV